MFKDDQHSGPEEEDPTDDRDDYLFQVLPIKEKVRRKALEYIATRLQTQMNESNHHQEEGKVDVTIQEVKQVVGQKINKLMSLFNKK